MSKPKLLITMGCSITEGVGCFAEHTLSENINDIKVDRNTFPIEHNELWIQICKQNKDNFHKSGWPNKLGKKLNYDKVLNLGFAGSSTSGQLKIFLEKYHKEYFEKYDVLLFWLLTDPTRISFYKDKMIHDFSITNNNGENIVKEYINTIIDSKIDPLLEQIFYIRLMNEICQNRKWKFLTTPFDFDSMELHKSYNNAEYLLDTESVHLWDKKYDHNHLSPICQHPNENGYEKYSELFYKQIKKFHPELINKNKVDNFTWEWNGAPKKWEKLEYNA